MRAASVHRKRLDFGNTRMKLRVSSCFLRKHYTVVINMSAWKSLSIVYLNVCISMRFYNNLCVCIQCKPVCVCVVSMCVHVWTGIPHCVLSFSCVRACLSMLVNLALINECHKNLLWDFAFLFNIFKCAQLHEKRYTSFLSGNRSVQRLITWSAVKYSIRIRNYYWRYQFFIF